MMIGVPSKEIGTSVGGVVRETMMMRSKTAFQMSISEAFLTIRRGSTQ